MRIHERSVFIHFRFYPKLYSRFFFSPFKSQIPPSDYYNLTRKIQVPSLPFPPKNRFRPFFLVKSRLSTVINGFVLIFQNLAALAGVGGMSGMRPSQFASTGMAGIPHAATGLSLQAAIANQAAYAGQLPAT